MLPALLPLHLHPVDEVSPFRQAYAPQPPMMQTIITLRHSEHEVVVYEGGRPSASFTFKLPSASSSLPFKTLPCALHGGSASGLDWHVLCKADALSTILLSLCCRGLLSLSLSGILALSFSPQLSDFGNSTEPLQTLASPSDQRLHPSSQISEQI